MTDNPLTHEEVQEAANAAAPLFRTLVTESVKKFGEKILSSSEIITASNLPKTYSINEFRFLLAP